MAGVIKLDEAVGLVSAIVNASDWTTFNDAVTTASSTDIVSATAAFTQADVGKLFSVAAAAGSGKPLIGYISSVTNSTTFVASVTPAVSLTLASLTYGGLSEDPRHPMWKITRAVLQRDIEVCNLILKTDNHPRRNFFTFSVSSTLSQTNTGTPMPSHSGEIRMMEIQGSDTTWRVGRQMPSEQLNKLTSWLNNQGGLFSTGSEGYYIIEDGQIYFTGNAARITSVDLSITPDACQAPSEYTGAVVSFAAGDVFQTEGDDLPAAQASSQMGAMTLAALIQGEAEGQ